MNSTKIKILPGRLGVLSQTSGSQILVNMSVSGSKKFWNWWKVCLVVSLAWIEVHSNNFLSKLFDWVSIV